MLVLAIFCFLFSNALTTRKDTAIFYSRGAFFLLLGLSILTYNNLYIFPLEKGISLYGGLFTISFLSHSFSLFIVLTSSIILQYNCFYHRILMKDEISSIKSLFTRKENLVLEDLGDREADQYRIVEYPLLLLFIICGAIFLMNSGDLISLFISIELQSYGLYILSTLHRDSEQATWGGLTYFLLGGLSSCFILLGSGLLYINSGATSLEGLYIITAITDILSEYSSLVNREVFVSLLDSYYINLSLIIITIGFLFKISAAPFHFWSPDVYDAIPTTVTTYVALIAKISIFIVLLEFVYFEARGINKEFSTFSWNNALLVSSFLSLIIGSVLGLTQHRLKRVYAYSTISHVGFILLALSVNSIESIQGYLFYILSYTISNLNAFIIIVTIGYTLYLYIYKQEVSIGEVGFSSVAREKDTLVKESNAFKNTDKDTKQGLASSGLTPRWLEKASKEDFLLVSRKKIKKITPPSMASKSNNENDNILSYSTSFKHFEEKGLLKDISNSPLQLVNQLKGYYEINPYLSLSLAITLFSFIGIPPLLGFFAKQMVLSAALDSGYVFITLIGIITSVIAAVYYLGIVKQMFFFKTDYTLNPYLTKLNYFGYYNNTQKASLVFTSHDIKISSALSIVISILTLLLSLFILIPNESFNLAKILTLLLFN